jgi:uncharacterized membrane protein YphA (DoxX/SURF4 family)
VTEQWERAQPWVSTLIRLVLAAVFGVAGALKLPDPAGSVRAVRAYQLLPEGAVQVVGYGLPVLEVALAFLLLVGLATRVAAGVSAALLVAFLVGVASAALRGLTIDCGCFGGGGTVAAEDTRYTAELVRDTALLGAALLLLARPRSRLSLDALLHAPPGPEPAGSDDLERPREEVR